MSRLRMEPGSLVPFWSLHMLTDNAGWGTAAWHVFRTEDGGRGWQDVTPPDPRLLEDDKYYRAYASFPAPSTGWVTMIDPQSPPEEIGVWRTGDGGMTWSRFSAGAPIPEVELHPILRAVDETTAWLLLDADIEPSADTHVVRLYRTVDGGTSWLETSLAAAKPVDMEFQNATTGFMVEALGDPEPSGLMVWRTQDAGATWSATPIPPPPDDPAYFERLGACDRLDLSVTQDAWAALTVECPLSDRALFRSGDHGNSWVSVPLPSPSSGTNQIVWFNAREGLQLGTVMYRTEDGGASWIRFKIVEWMGAFSFANRRSGWAIAESGPYVALVHTDDSGRSWEELDPRIVAQTATELSDLDTSRSNPAPLGVPVEYFGTLLITVEEVIVPADDLVRQANPGNPPPSIGSQYIVVSISLECTRPGDGTCTFLDNDLFAVLDDSDETHPALEGIEGLGALSFSPLAPGERTEGVLVFETPANASGYILLFSRFMLGEAFFALR